MVPSNERINDLILNAEKAELQKTQTFSLNIINNSVVGKIDELEALKQSIYLTLSVEADQYIIYPYTYGLRTIDLIGKPNYYVMAVIPGRIKEALSSDNRIVDVSNFEFNVQKNKLTVTFTVSTIYGDVEQETEVAY